MNIGDVAKITGVSVKMIRYYEEIGLLPAPLRAESGYRFYAPAQVHELHFIRQARDLGFSVDQMGSLLELWRNRSRASADVKSIALRHIDELHEKVRALQAMEKTLRHLADDCYGDDRPACPILDGFVASDAPIALRRRPRFGAVDMKPRHAH